MNIVKNADFSNDEILEKELLEKFNIKLEKNEIVLTKYTCNPKADCKFRLVYMLAILFFMVFLVSGWSGKFFLIIGVIIIFFNLYGIFIEYKNLKYEGFYVTNKRLITFNGSSFLLENIYINTSSTRLRSANEMNFYNKRSYIQMTHLWVKESKQDDLDNFLLSLYKVSNNDKVLCFGSEKILPQNPSVYYLWRKIKLMTE